MDHIIGTTRFERISGRIHKNLHHRIPVRILTEAQVEARFLATEIDREVHPMVWIVLDVVPADGLIEGLNQEMDRKMQMGTL